VGKQLRYLEIAQTLKDKIRNGTYPQGKSLPSQKELSEIFSTSVMTARQALAELVEEGIITIVHGVGTFVSAPEFHSNDISLQGFQNEMDRQKIKILNTVVSKEYGLSRPILNTLFNDNNLHFSCLTRLRTLEDIPVILQRSYVSDENKIVIEEYIKENSLYQLFTKKTNTMIALGQEIVSPVLLPEQELELLKLKGPCTAFQTRRISISLNEKVVLYDEAYLPEPYVIMASRKQGKINKFKYIINKEGTSNSIMSFNDPDLWKDLI